MRRRASAIASLVLLLALDGVARAGGSGGSGGPVGTRSDWPCTGCYTEVPATYSASSPASLLVALHGDEGTAQYAWQVWAPYTDAQGYILLAPQCPSSEGCSGSFWQWGGDPAWLLEQVAAVEGEYNVELDREYLSGWSGGATYVGAAAPLFVPKFAAFNLNGGGVPPQPATCPSCLAPAYFMIGDQDFLFDYAQATHDYFVGCGHEVVWDELAGLDHQNGISALYTQDKAATILDWLDARPNLCPTDPAMGGSGTGGSGTGGNGTGGVGTGGPGSGAAVVGGAGPAGGAGNAPTNPDGSSEEDSGCGCRVGRRPRAAGDLVLVWLACAAAALRRARRRARGRRFPAHQPTIAASAAAGPPKDRIRSPGPRAAAPSLA